MALFPTWEEIGDVFEPVAEGVEQLWEKGTEETERLSKLGGNQQVAETKEPPPSEKKDNTLLYVLAGGAVIYLLLLR